MPASAWINLAAVEAYLGRRITLARDHNMTALVRIRDAVLTEQVAFEEERSSC